jgi:hypothetical protein
MISLPRPDKPATTNRKIAAEDRQFSCGNPKQRYDDCVTRKQFLGELRVVPALT